MFDFEKLEVYKKAKHFHSGIAEFIKEGKLDKISKDQLYRASFSVILNIAEGTGRFSKADKRNFYVISRSSVFECVAILDILRDHDNIELERFNRFYTQADELSRILYAMVKNLEIKKV